MPSPLPVSLSGRSRIDNRGVLKGENIKYWKNEMARAGKIMQENLRIHRAKRAGRFL